MQGSLARLSLHLLLLLQGLALPTANPAAPGMGEGRGRSGIMGLGRELPADWGRAAAPGPPGGSPAHSGVRASEHVGDKVSLLAGHLSLSEWQVPAEGEEQHVLLL